jgi:hypothetical protein
MLVELKNLLRIEQGHFVVYFAFSIGQVPASKGIYDLN